MNSKHVTELKPFNTDDDNIAIEAARSDNSEFTVTNIISYFGNPYKRSTLGFTIEFSDGTVKEGVCLSDLAHNSQLDKFISDNKELEIIKNEFETAHQANQRRKEFMQWEIEDRYKIGSKILVDIRTREIFGVEWYDKIKLKDKDTTLYLLGATIVGNKQNIRNKNTIEIRFDEPVEHSGETNDGYHVKVTTNNIRIDRWILHYHCYTQEQLDDRPYKVLINTFTERMRKERINHISKAHGKITI